ncbi:hypothetical protein QR98_0050100, partial [Sarcoptes scabiei]
IKTNPKSWPGENGKGVETSPEEEKEKNEKFKLNQFNLMASDRIALNRTLMDVQKKKVSSIPTIHLYRDCFP